MKRISEYFGGASAPKTPKFAEKPSFDTSTTQNESASASTSGETQSVSAKKRDFQRKWLDDSRFKNWLTYDDEKNVMQCRSCISTGKRNPFVTGCQNFKTSTLDRHMSSADHLNSLLDRKQADQLNSTVHSLYDKKRAGYYLCIKVGLLAL